MMFALLFSAVLESEKPLVCLDPGHPSEVSRGATGKEISELEAVWKIALLTRPMLEGKGVRVVMTKKSLEEMVSNRRRAEIANQAGADLAVRLHMDAAPVRGWMTVFPDRVGTAADGTEGPSEKVIRLSRTAAGAFHSAAIRSLDGLTPDRGVISDAKTFVGSRQGALTGSIFSQVPVVLAEVLTITLPEDEKIAATESGRKRIAEAVTAGTMAALEALQAHSD